MNLEHIISGCLRKDPNAERDLYVFLARKIFGLCRRYADSDGDAKDMMQDSVIKIFSKLDQYKSSKGSFMAWANTIVLNTIYVQHRKKRFNFELLDERMIDSSRFVSNEVDALFGAIAYNISHEELVGGIRKLPEDYRDILNLYIFENWKHAEIASVLGIKESSSRSKLTRAKIMLREILSKNFKVVGHGT